MRIHWLIAPLTISTAATAQTAPRDADSASSVRVWASASGGIATIAGSSNVMNRIALAGSLGPAMLTIRRVGVLDGYGDTGSMEDFGALIGWRSRGTSYFSVSGGVATSRRTRSCTACASLFEKGVTYEVGGHLASRWVSLGLILGGTRAGEQTSWDARMLSIGIGRFGRRRH